LRSTFAAGDHLGALLDGIGDVRLDLLDRLHVAEGPDHRAGLEPVTQVWPPLRYFNSKGWHP